MGDALELFGVLSAVFGSLAVPYVVYVLIQKFVVRDGAGSGPTAEIRALRERVARLEQAVDVVAVEVERVGEAQRFTDRLIGDRLVGDRVVGDRQGGARPLGETAPPADVRAHR